MIILGLDPGTARVGWAVIQESPGGPKPISYGVIETQKIEKPELRLKRIYEAVMKLFSSHKPDTVAIEELFFAANAKTAIAVGQARGVLLLACSQQNLPVFSYTPLAVKRSVAGDGKADKKQIQYMVTRQLHLVKIPKPDDAADALAIALTHAFSHRMNEKII